MLITMIHGALYVYGFGAFFIHFQNAFGASRAQIGLVLGLARLEGGLIAPVAGFLIEQYFLGGHPGLLICKSAGGL